MMEDVIIRGMEPLGTSPMNASPAGVAKPGAPGFTEMLEHAIEEVNRLGHEAGRLEDAVAKGENMNIHQAIIAGEKAGLSFQLMMQVRNKLLDAYQEISRMQV